MPSASESFDTYLAKSHHHPHHCSSIKRHKQHSKQQQHRRCQCKYLKRASQSLDNENFSNNGKCCDNKRRNFRLGGNENSVEPDEDEEDVEYDNGEGDEKTRTRGAQSWRALRAVVAYYCSLRKIKREDILKYMHISVLIRINIQEITYYTKLVCVSLKICFIYL